MIALKRSQQTKICGSVLVRWNGLATLAKAKESTSSNECSQQELQTPKSFDDIPGPSKWTFPLQFLPGGALHNSNVVDIHNFIRGTYGNIARVDGTFGKPDTVFTYNPEDYEKVYRTEGAWPIRTALYTFTHYRKVLRPEVFQNVGGLVSEQGEAWADVRGKVNPILMKPEIVKQNLPAVNEIADQFVERIENQRDPSTGELTFDFSKDITKWSFESISAIALNKRLNLLTSANPDKDVERLAKAMGDFFQFSYDFDIAPSFWKYYETPQFKKLIKNYDDITEITSKYIDEAMTTFKMDATSGGESVLEKLCKVDKKVAMVMAMDMLMGGIDTTTSAFNTILYLLAKNPSKQAKLREELQTVFPDRSTPFTAENTKNLPYLRACIKEGLRITPITPANFRITAKDLVLSGYHVPKGTGVLMSIMHLCNEDKYFPRSQEYLPERWLKSGPDACPHAKNTNPFVYLPFGFGPRTCIGKRIAEMEIETLLAKLVRNYHVTWESEEEMKYISNIILVPAGNMHYRFKNV